MGKLPREREVFLLIELLNHGTDRKLENFVLKFHAETNLVFLVGRWEG